MRCFTQSLAKRPAFIYDLACTILKGTRESSMPDIDHAYEDKKNRASAETKLIGPLYLSCRLSNPIDGFG